nr:integrase, catalytic region, zinc finger, CCHC-type, peptidase aspartic, catalytic [Tanacetum cinerariifolium]
TAWKNDLESVENGPFLWPTVEENRVTKPKKYFELSTTKAIQADCDVKATNIILQGLPPEVYALVSNHKVAKELWARIQLLMEGTSLTKQERELNNKFLNTLPPEWSKFVIDVKLVRDMHTTNVDQLHAYLGQHEFHANEVRLMHELYHNLYNPSSSIPQVEYAPSVHQQFDYSYPDTSLVVLVFQKGDDPIHVINHMMSFLTAELERHKDQVRILKEVVTLLKNDFQREESRNIDRELALEKQELEPKLYDGSVIQKTNAIVICDSEETLMLEDESCSKMLQKQKDPMMSEKKVNTKPNSKNSEEPNLSTRPTIVGVPKELPKVNMVNSSLKKLKFHLVSFDVVVKERTTATAITKGTWGFEHIKACFRDEIIPFVKALKDLFNSFDQFLINELTEVQNVFNQMKQAVEQHRVETNRFQDKMKEVLNENERLLEQAISKDIVNIVEKALVISTLKDTLRKLKGKAVVDKAVTLYPIDPELLRIVVALLAPKLRNNRTAHYDYLKHTQEEIATLREIVKNERFLNPLNTSLDYACNKLMDVTPVNKTKKIKVTENFTSSGNTPIKTTSSSNVVSNKPMLSSAGVNLPTSASRSQPPGNTTRDKIQQTQSRAKKNKLKAYPRNVRTSLHNKKSVVNTKDIASVPNSKMNMNFDLQCATCNGCLFSDNHDSCVLEFINSVNAYVVQIVLWYLDSGCSKHMTDDRSQLTNFVNRFLGVDLMTGSRENNLYTLSLGYIMASSPIYLLSKASKTKSWLWHRTLSHMNFGAINHLARQGLV